MRMAVAAQKVSQPKDFAALRPPDDHGSASAFLKQTDAADDERAHDALAKLGFSDQQRPQPIRRYDQGIDCTLRVRINERRATGQLRKLAQERPCPVCNYEPALAGRNMSGHVHVARQYDGQALIDLARLGQDFARLVRPKRAEAAHSLDFRVLKGRERLLPPRFNDRLLSWRHARPTAESLREFRRYELRAISWHRAVQSITSRVRCSNSNLRRVSTAMLTCK